MADKYISELDEKTSGTITGSYNLVIQQPEGKANTTFKISVTEFLNWIKENTDYSEVYSLPIGTSELGDFTIEVLGNEVVRIKASDGNFGIKTSEPSASLDVWSSDEINGDIMITPESGDRMGFYVSSASDSPEAITALHIGRKIYNEDAVFVPLVSIEKTGDITVNGDASVKGDSFTDGYSRLGSVSPEIKIKTLSGTTGNAGAVTQVTHSLDKSKIISCNVLVKNKSTNAWTPPNDGISTSCLYTFTIDNTELNVTLHDTASNVASSDFICTIIYVK